MTNEEIKHNNQYLLNVKVFVSFEDSDELSIFDNILRPFFNVTDLNSWTQCFHVDNFLKVRNFYLSPLCEIETINVFTIKNNSIEICINVNYKDVIFIVEYSYTFIKSNDDPIIKRHIIKLLNNLKNDLKENNKLETHIKYKINEFISEIKNGELL